MTTRYLLPCACGKDVTVDAKKAGLNVSCACGASLEVPTRRGLERLKRLAETPREVRGWGPRHGALFLGGLLLLAGLAAQVVPGLFPYRDPSQERIATAPADELVLFQTILRGGIDVDETDEVNKELKAKVSRQMMWGQLGWVAIGLGALVLVAAFLLPAKARQEPPPRRAERPRPSKR
jgi:hypothetical protein